MDDQEITRPAAVAMDDNDAYGLDAAGADMTFDTRPAQVSSRNFMNKGPQSLTIDTEQSALSRARTVKTPPIPSIMMQAEGAAQAPTPTRTSDHSGDQFDYFNR